MVVEMKKFLFCLVIVLGVYFIKTEHIFKRNSEENVMKEETSRTLTEALESTFFISKYQEEYKKINYYEEENFIETINCFLDLGYSSEEINAIYDFLTLQNREKLVALPKLDLKAYYTIPNFEVDKLERYEKYQKAHHLALNEAVLKVNIGLDHDFYSTIEEVENPESYVVLVNKYRSLGQYVPTDLVPLSYDSKYQLREKARDAFEKLVSQALVENVFLRPYSAYRSFDYQNSLYNTYVNRDGKEVADSYSARPGHSEHQTGLAVDVWSRDYNFITEADAKWLKEHSYQYGFIVRYTKENQAVTGYIEEPWHLRYVGENVASTLYQQGITFDEYYDLYLK